MENNLLPGLTRSHPEEGMGGRGCRKLREEFELRLRPRRVARY
jgi:hypothetical protein